MSLEHCLKSRPTKKQSRRHKRQNLWHDGTGLVERTTSYKSPYLRNGNGSKYDPIIEDLKRGHRQ